jgi:endogenous inhibitor of DNA gyrase (YacG/DUF329 family)
MPTVPCPTCGRDVEWTDKSPFRPFCSERCKLIDLGGWAAGQRAIPGEPIPEPPDDDSTSSKEGH